MHAELKEVKEAKFEGSWSNLSCVSEKNNDSDWSWKKHDSDWSRERTHRSRTYAIATLVELSNAETKSSTDTMIVSMINLIWKLLKWLLGVNVDMT